MILAKGEGVRSRIALIGVIDVGMGIDMEDGQRRVAPMDSAHDRMRHGMIAAEADQRIA